MIVDDLLHPLGDARYLLSPEDLYALRQIPEIIQIGISALKIEGRYKDANYVALATKAYRKAVDEAWAGRPQSVDQVEELQLAQVYSRGLGPHFVSGTNHQKVVNGRFPAHRGLLMGRVTQVLSQGVRVAPNLESSALPLKAGDGVVLMPPIGVALSNPKKGGAFTMFASYATATWSWNSATRLSISPVSAPETNCGAPMIRTWTRWPNHTPRRLLPFISAR